MQGIFAENVRFKIGRLGSVNFKKNTKHPEGCIGFYSRM